MNILYQISFVSQFSFKQWTFFALCFFFTCVYQASQYLHLLAPFQVSPEAQRLDKCLCKETVRVSFADFGSLNNASESSRISSCSDRASARGPRQKVVSFSLFGEYLGPYYQGMERNVERVKEVYPGWIIRLYMDLSQQDNFKWACDLACSNQELDLCDVTNIPGFGNASNSSGDLWRFLVVGDPLVERFMVRDSDSYIPQREVDSVNDWLRSGKCFHVMRDHPQHAVFMLAGMWGGCNIGKFSEMKDIGRKLVTYSSRIKQDQYALQDHMWHKINQDILIHDSYHCMIFKDSKPFPTKRTNFTFVGMPTYKAEGFIDSKCPRKCRPLQHQDWEYC